MNSIYLNFISVIKVFLITTIVLVVGIQPSFGQKLYDINWGKSGVVWGSSAVLFGGSKWIAHHKKPITAERIALLDPATLLSIERGASENFSLRSDLHSDYFRDAIYFAPFALLFSKQGRENSLEILSMYTQVFALNGGITKMSKEGFGRFRPYAFNDLAPLELQLDPTTKRSFISGHTSHVASLSFFTAKVYADLYPESKMRYLIWTLAATAPAVTGYLRVNAGRHFISDVLLGYAVGAAVGYFIPVLHQRKDVKIAESQDGVGLVFMF